MKVFYYISVEQHFILFFFLIKTILQNSNAGTGNWNIFWVVSYAELHFAILFQAINR